MQYQTLLLAALSATTTLAAPLASRNFDTEIRVSLSSQSTETGAQVTFIDGQRDVKTPAASGPFETVELTLGADVENQEYRCQILDENDRPIVVIRGANTDITFADGGKGAWTLKTPSVVSSVICDPAFKKTEAGGTDVRVILLNDGREIGSQTVFADVNGRLVKNPTGTRGPFTTVELLVGPLAQQDLRCQILDPAGKPITVKRGQNVDTTFADGGNGRWTFLNPTEAEVSSIVCDPAFKKAAA